MIEPGALTGVVAEPVALATAIQRGALLVPGVVGLSPGRGFVEATYGAGGPIQGVGMGVYAGRLEVSVHVVTGHTPIPSLAQRLRRTIGSIIHEYTGRSADAINLYIDDIILEPRLSGEGVV